MVNTPGRGQVVHYAESLLLSKRRLDMNRRDVFRLGGLVLLGSFLFRINALAEKEEQSMLDHIVYAVPDLEKVVSDLEERVGVRPTPGGRHPGLGTRNALLSLREDSYLEIIGPDPEQPQPAQPRPFGIDTLTAPRLVTWLAKAVDLDQQIEKARVAGYDIGQPISMSRELPDGTRIQWRLALPPQPLGDGLVPVLIEWHTDLHPAKTSARGCTLVEMYGEHPRPETIRPVLEAIGVTLDVRQGPIPALTATLTTPKGRVVLR
jgi:hypothetical protein